MCRPLKTKKGSFLIILHRWSGIFDDSNRMEVGKRNSSSIGNLMNGVDLSSKFQNNNRREGKGEESLHKHATEENFITRFLLRTFAPIFLVMTCPIFVILLWYTAVHCGGSFTVLSQEFISRGFFVTVAGIMSNINYLNPVVYASLFLYIVSQIFLMKFLPGKTIYGPITRTGNIPVYKDNGFYCYMISLAVFTAIAIYLRVYTSYRITIVYDYFDQILISLNILSIILCGLLCYKGYYFPSTSDSGSSGNIFFDYYWGTELYPRICGIDIKVLTNCRFGMTAWSLLVIIFALKNYELYGFVSGVWVSTVLQTIYFVKFFVWEGGYMSTIDIMMDHAGFYICWGCLVFVPGLYASISLYLASCSESLGDLSSLLVLIIGLSSCFINYWADLQKQAARSSGGKCTIFGKPAEVIQAEFISGGKKKISLLLISGFWGMTRHFHYLPELVLALCWCLPCGWNLMPYSYFIFLFVLLVHRTFRDDTKCREKYGKYWTEYCARVPYKILPYIF